MRMSVTIFRVFGVAFLCFIDFGNFALGQLGLDERIQSDVENFNLELGIASQIGVSRVAEFCDLIDEQKTRIREIRESMDKEAARIKRSSSSPETKLAKLTDLRNRQDGELKKILLPQQLKRLENMPFLNIVLYEEGFATSVVNGFIAELLELSNDERVAIKKAADEAHEKYREVLKKAQLDAIQSIRASIPREKLDRFEKVTEVLIGGDKTIWPIDDSMLDTRRRARIGATLIPLK